MKTDNYYIQLAIDYLGSSIRDNTRDEKIAIGKMIEDGTWDDNDA